MNKQTEQKQEWEREFEKIQKEWEKHRTMNACTICDSPKEHTYLKDFIRKVRQEAYNQGQKDMAEAVRLEAVDVGVLINPNQSGAGDGYPEMIDLNNLRTAGRGEGFNQAVQELDNKIAEVLEGEDG